MPLSQLRRWLRSLIGKSPLIKETLPAEAAYTLWAPTYADHAHNPLMQAEEEAMRPLLPSLYGMRVLDVACGTGRWGRIATEQEAASVTGFDNSLAMLHNASLAQRSQANMTVLPCSAASFDVALCGLAIGHLAMLDGFVREMARVLATGGTLLLSHFHPEGHKAGWKREFTSPHGRRIAVAHHPHTLGKISTVFSEFGFVIDKIVEPRVGIEITKNFPGSDDIYQRYHGLPALLIVRARRIS